MEISGAFIFVRHCEDGTFSYLSLCTPLSLHFLRESEFLNDPLPRSEQKSLNVRRPPRYTLLRQSLGSKAELWQIGMLKC